MKSTTLAVVVFFLVLSGVSLAAQSDERKDHSSMMQEMMKGEKQGEHKDGMMHMMKMMDQCSQMMESSHSSQETKENPSRRSRGLKRSLL